MGIMGILSILKEFFDIARQGIFLLLVSYLWKKSITSFATLTHLLAAMSIVMPQQWTGNVAFVRVVIYLLIFGQ